MSSVKAQFGLPYLDDIFAFRHTPREYIICTRLVPSLLEVAGVTLNLKKCASFMDRINNPGHVIPLGTLEVGNHTTDTIGDLNMPTIKSGLPSFIDLWNKFCLFPPNFASIAFL